MYQRFRSIAQGLLVALLSASALAGSAGAITGFRHPEAPRLLDYYLRSDIAGKEDILSRWDMLVFPYPLLDAALPTLQAIRALNPDQIILAYIDPVLISDNPSGIPGSLQYDFHAGVDSLWLAYSTDGEVISFWEHALHVNITEVCPLIEGRRYRDYFVEFVRERLYPYIEDGTIDGVFLDEMSNGGWTWWQYAIAPGEFFDYDLNQIADAPDSLSAWLSRSMRVFADSVGTTLPQGGLVLGNNVKPHHPNLNGKLYEAFPGSNEGDLEGTLNDIDVWNSLEVDENVTSINGVYGNPNNLREFRYRFTGSLLTDNYFSFDYTTQDHYQLRWYELFDFELGLPLGPRYTIGEAPIVLCDFEYFICHWIEDAGMSDLSLTQDPALVLQGNSSLVADITVATAWPALLKLQIPGGWQGLEEYTISFRYRVLESEAEENKLFFRYWTPTGEQYSGFTHQTAITEGCSGLYRGTFQLAGLNNYEITLKVRSDATVVIDSLSVVVGTGGLLARDYEAGTVICNGSDETRALPYDSYWQLVDGDGQWGAYPGWLAGESINIPRADGVVFRYTGTGVGDEPVAPTTSLQLGGPWPNPGNPTLGLELSGGAGQEVRLTLHDLRGRRVAELWEGRVGEVGKRFTFRPGQGPLPELASGLYLVRAEGGGTVITRKWVLLR